MVAIGDAAKIGSRLRAARLAGRLSLAEVAARSDLTKGFLSKVERDQVNASVAALIRICTTLNLPVGSLFYAAVGELIPATDRPVINFGGEGIQEFLLSPSSEKRIQAILSVIEPGGGSGPEPYSLPSDVEFAFVISGEVEISVAGVRRVLTAGDALTLSPRAEHAFRAVPGASGAQVLWVLAPALPDAISRVTERIAAGQNGASDALELWKKEE